MVHTDLGTVKCMVIFSSFQPVCILASLSKVRYQPIHCTFLTFSFQYWQIRLEKKKNIGYINFKLPLKDYYLNTKVVQKMKQI